MKALTALWSLSLLACEASDRTDVAAAEVSAPRKANVTRTATAEASAAVRTGETVRLALLPPSLASDGAASSGFLLVEGRCLYVTDRNGSGARTTPAFLIPDVGWDAEKGVLLAHGKAFSPGQRVMLGGSMATNPALLAWVQKPDPSCDSSSVWITGSIDALPAEIEPKTGAAS